MRYTERTSPHCLCAELKSSVRSYTGRYGALSKVTASTSVLRIGATAERGGGHQHRGECRCHRCELVCSEQPALHAERRRNRPPRVRAAVRDGELARLSRIMAALANAPRTPVLACSLAKPVTFYATRCCSISIMVARSWGIALGNRIYHESIRSPTCEDYTHEHTRCKDRRP